MSQAIQAARAARSTTPGNPAAGPPPTPTPIRRVRRFVGAHQLGVFVVLAFLLSWATWLLSPGQHNPTGPAIAAFIVVALSDRGLVRRFGRQVLDVRVRLRWLAAAILVPVVVVVGSVALNTLLGAPAPTGAQLGLWTSLPLELLGILVLIGLGEEIGWTAFAAPRALAARTVVVAFVLLAALRALWHLPLWLAGELYAVEFLTIVAIQFFILWLYRRSGGRWVTAAVFHSVNNILAGSFLFQMVDGQDRVRLLTVQAVLYALLALGALVLDRRRPAAAISHAPADDPQETLA